MRCKVVTLAPTHDSKLIPCMMHPLGMNSHRWEIYHPVRPDRIWEIYHPSDIG